jgi:hypothetical protein
MAKAKHTEGPWEIVEGTSNPYFEFRVRAGEHLIAFVCADPDGENGLVPSADAHLIATAPELYEALDELYRHVQFIVSIAPHYSEMVEAALKKARGEQ